MKLTAIEVGLCLAYIAAHEDWWERHDSREGPIIPIRDLTPIQLKDWLSSQARNAAECYLLDAEYPVRSADEPVNEEFTDKMDQRGAFQPDDDGAADAAWREISNLCEHAPPGLLEVVDTGWMQVRHHGRVTLAGIARELDSAPSTVRVVGHRQRKGVRRGCSHPR